MFLQQIFYNGYLLCNKAHGKAHCGTQRCDAKKRNDGVLKAGSDADALKYIEYKRMQQIDAESAVGELMYKATTPKVMAFESEEET